MPIRSGRWWKFDEYEVRDGRVGPVAGAKLSEYDPWDPTPEADSRPERGPALDLINVVSKVPPAGAFDLNAIQVTRELELAVCSWCSRYGLLGLLLHGLELVRIDTWQVAYVAGEWKREVGQVDELMTAVEAEGHVATSYLEGTVEEGGHPSYDWWPYFPGVDHADPELWEQLVPGSESFWRWYREDVRHFVQAARLFANAVGVLGARTAGSGIWNKKIHEYSELNNDYDRRAGDRDFSGDRHRKVFLDAPGAVGRLNTLSSRTVFDLAIGGGDECHFSVSSPSLLGHLAKQAAQDLAGGRYLVTCKCGNSFSTNRRNQKWCSDDCGYRYRQQAYRKREKEKEGAAVIS